MTPISIACKRDVEFGGRNTSLTLDRVKNRCDEQLSRIRIIFLFSLTILRLNFRKNSVKISVVTHEVLLLRYELISSTETTRLFGLSNNYWFKFLFTSHVSADKNRDSFSTHFTRFELFLFDHK